MPRILSGHDMLEQTKRMRRTILSRSTNLSDLSSSFGRESPSDKSNPRLDGISYRIPNGSSSMQTSSGSLCWSSTNSETGTTASTSPESVGDDWGHFVDFCGQDGGYEEKTLLGKTPQHGLCFVKNSKGLLILPE